MLDHRATEDLARFQRVMLLLIFNLKIHIKILVEILKIAQSKIEFPNQVYKSIGDKHTFLAEIRRKLILDQFITKLLLAK